MLQASLGLEFDPVQDEIRFRDPHLPSFLESVLFHNLGLGESRLDIMAHRQAGNVSIEIVRAEGSSRVTVIPGNATSEL
jgi:hypothetical protein